MMRKLAVIGAVAVTVAIGCGRDQGSSRPGANRSIPPSPSAAIVEGDADGPNKQPEAVDAATIRISGEAFLRERITLPADAQLEVRLLEVRGDQLTGRQIAEVRVPSPRRPPIPFEMTLFEGDLAAGASYVLSATISRRGVVAFATDSPLPVLDPGTPATGLRLLLRRSG